MFKTFVLMKLLILKIPFFIIETFKSRKALERMASNGGENGVPLEKIRRFKNDWSKKALDLVGVKYKFTFKENFTLEDNFVLIANHRSFLDILLIEQAIQKFHKKNSTFVAKKELLSYPIMGKLFQLFRVLFIDRKNPKDFVRLMLDIKKTLKDNPNNNVIVVFPEGTRSRNEDCRDIVMFKEGFLKIAQSRKLNIMPVFINGNPENYLEEIGNPEKEIEIVIGNMIIAEGKTVDEVFEIFKKQIN